MSYSSRGSKLNQEKYGGSLQLSLSSWCPYILFLPRWENLAALLAHLTLMGKHMSRKNIRRTTRRYCGSGISQDNRSSSRRRVNCTNGIPPSPRLQDCRQLLDGPGMRSI